MKAVDIPVQIHKRNTYSVYLHLKRNISFYFFKFISLYYYLCENKILKMQQPHDGNRFDLQLFDCVFPS